MRKDVYLPHIIKKMLHDPKILEKIVREDIKIYNIVKEILKKEENKQLENDFNIIRKALKSALGDPNVPQQIKKRIADVL